MNTALVNGKRRLAEPNLRGECEFCHANGMIAKCGPQKIRHWAHPANSVCDPWRRGETDWHRAWKHEFPVSWQERFMSPMTVSATSLM